MGDNDARHGTPAVIHGERRQVPASGIEDVVVSVHLPSTCSVPSIDPDVNLETLGPDAGEYLHSRLSNPTRNALEHRFAALEEADHTLAFVSGTVTITATMTVMVRPGDHIVAFEDLYGGTKTMLTRLFANRLNVDVSFVDATDPENVAATMREETVLVWMETPTNPPMHLCDIGTIATIADEGNAVFGVDNTFFGPQFQTPLSLGADVVIHSAMEYLNNHSDSIGGAVVTNREDVLEEPTFLQRVGMGSILSPFDSYLTLRGIKTFPLRMRQHEINTMEIAELLNSHEAIARVLYPGLESHPQHDLAAYQQSGFGGILSFEPDTDLDETAEFLGTLREFPLAVGLGSVESLIEHPATMTHPPLSQTKRNALGISDLLLRLSVGTEHVDDLRSNLMSALSVL